MTLCQISGCRRLETKCADCGRTTCAATLPPIMEWINIKDSNPIDLNLKHILGFSKKGFVHTLHWDYGEWSLWETDTGFSGEGVDITHWMPLPITPEEK